MNDFERGFFEELEKIAQAPKKPVGAPTPVQSIASGLYGAGKEVQKAIASKKPYKVQIPGTKYHYETPPVKPLWKQVAPSIKKYLGVTEF
jgi:hypothetical protein